MILYDLLARTAAAAPDAPAVQHHDGVMTYRDLLSAADGFAGGLASLGLGRHGRVALLLPNCPAFVIAYLGGSRAGATMVPMNVLYRPDEARYILADCGAEAIVTAEPFRPLIEALRPLLPGLRHVIMLTDGECRAGEVRFSDFCASTPAPHVPLSERDIAVIIYTSGTTGRPKGAMLTYRNLQANADACAQVLTVTRDDCFFTALPLFHAFAALVCLVLPISRGARMQLTERFLPAHTLQLLVSSGATIFCGVPSMFGLLLQIASESRPDLSSLRICVSGGAPLPPEVWIEFERLFDVRMVEGYGLTEASPVIAVNPPDGVRKPGSIGPPLPGIQVKIVDDTGRAVGPGVIGELVVRGENVMKGYLARPAETRQILRHGWLHTGDLARTDADGYLYIAGRKKEMIIVGGLNVYPGEVERVLVDHPAVLEAAAFGIPDAARGEAVWAAVVLRPDDTATPRELLAFCREKLAAYKVPRGLEILDQLPKNVLGKVLRQELHHAVVARQESQARLGAGS